MYAAIATTLQMAAREMQLSGGPDQPGYRRIMAQLREVSKELAAFDRRTQRHKAVPVDFSEILQDAAGFGSLTVGQDRGDSGSSSLEEVMVEGPAHDLRDLLSALFEYARTVGRDPVRLGARVEPSSDTAGAMCATELVIQSSDLPDFLRRKLWDAVSVRGGEVSIISEPDACRVEFTLPIERRS